MELNFLGKKTAEVSTGKSAPEKLKRVEDIEYNKSKGNLEQKPIQAEANSLYAQQIKRCREYVEQQGFKIVDMLKDALRDRANGDKSCTLREADIALRNELHLNGSFLEMQFKAFGTFLAEETVTLTEGIFELRSAYNKGIQWRKLKRHLCKPEKQLEGDERLEEIKKLLSHKGFALHPEELEEGFHQDLLKPEYMDWQQFTLAMQRAIKFKSQETKQREQEEKEAVKNG